MKTVRSFEELPAKLRYPILTIGSFDGLHRGHQEIIRTVVRRARERAGTSVVLTFDPHPQRVVSPADAPPLLQTAQQKLRHLDEMGIQYVVALPFTPELSRLDPDEFIRVILLDRIQAREIRVGANFRFGHKRSGNVEQLRRIGFQLGLLVYEVPEVSFRQTKISSTSIRRAVQSGRAGLARHLLGRPFALEGKVVSGTGRGAGLGFATANLDVANELLPGDGVYAGRVRLEEKLHTAVINVGRRPTLHGPNGPRVVEAHLLDFGGDLYERQVEAEFCVRLRAEQKFASAEELAGQIARDIMRTRKIEALA